MKNNTLKIFSKTSNLQRNDKNIIFFQDYVEDISLSKVREFSEGIFRENKEFLRSYIHNGYEITWAWYGDIFSISQKYMKYEKIILHIERVKYDQIIFKDVPNDLIKLIRMAFPEISIINLDLKKAHEIRIFLLNFVGLIYSLFSLVVSFFKRNNRVASYTGDFIFKNSRCDIRLIELYKLYDRNNINFIEFIRMTSGKNFIVNIFKRRRMAIYVSSFQYFINLFFKNTHYKKRPKNFQESLLYSYHGSNLALQKEILVFEKIFNFLGVKKFFGISFSSRSASLFFAAKTIGAPIIGIMHGLQQRDYAVYEFIEPFNNKNLIGCDYYGTWSLHYKNYFKEYSKIHSNIIYSGPLRSVSSFQKKFNFSQQDDEKIKVLVISEPHASFSDLVPFIKALIESKEICLGIKLRPMIKDNFLEILENFGLDISSIEIVDDELLKAGKSYDIFIGSYSTAIIEACLISKLSLLIYTNKWGDYFDLNSSPLGPMLLTNDPGEFINIIKLRIENENKLKSIIFFRERFFGNFNKNGAEWIVNLIS